MTFVDRAAQESRPFASVEILRAASDELALVPVQPQGREAALHQALMVVTDFANDMGKMLLPRLRGTDPETVRLYRDISDRMIALHAPWQRNGAAR